MKSSHSFFYTMLILGMLFLCCKGNAHSIPLKKAHPIVSKDSIIKDSSFFIKDNPAKYYLREFKNGQPYQGYFKRKTAELIIVDYYQSSKKICQYSYDFLKRAMEEENGYSNLYNADRIVLDLASTYKNEKIYSGYEYDNNKNGLITKRIEAGRLIRIHIDVLAMHSFNRITLNETKGDIEITFLGEENAKILINGRQDILTCSLIKNTEVVGYKTNSVFDFSKVPKNSIIRSFILKDNPLSVVMNVSASENNDSPSLDFFQNIPLFQFNTLESFYQKLNLLLEIEDVASDQLLIAYVQTNDKSTIDNGIYWNDKNGGTYQEYIKEEYLGPKKCELKDFEKAINSFFEKIYEK